MIVKRGYVHDYEQNFFKEKKAEKHGKLPSRARPTGGARMRKPRSPIGKVSAKRKEENKLYKVAKEEWRRERIEKDGFQCEFYSPDGVRCSSRGADSPHHKMGRVGQLLYDKNLFLSLCGRHHQYIHFENPAYAYDKGYMIKRI